MAVINKRVGPWLYGALFCVVLPLGFWAFTAQLQNLQLPLWPTVCPPLIGWALLAASVVGEAIAFWQLRRQGEGLPMNAYPTKHWAMSGIYGALAHPLYFFFVVGAAGISIGVQSREGLWITTPLLACFILALVYGYEREATYARLGRRVQTPWLGLPAESGEPLGFARSIAALASAMLPWSIAYVTLSQVPAPANAVDVRMTWENAIPLSALAWWVYSLAYVWPIAGLLTAKTSSQWRRQVRSAWCMTIAGFAIMWLWPNYAELRAIEATGWEQQLQAWNRTYDAAWLAFPSFHMGWTTLAALATASHRPSTKKWSWMIVLAMGWSCVATGSHAVLDVFGGVVLAFIAWFHAELWQWLVRRTNVYANAWNAWQIGGVRIIQHARWSALAAGLGAALAMLQTSTDQSDLIFWILVGGFIGAVLWGHLIEGSSRLARPLGYFGFVVGCAVVALVLMIATSTSELGATLASSVVAAPLAQAIGRLRCVEQGCCHGRPTRSAYGHVVYRCQSRIVALAGLKGISIHPTALYSALFHAILLLFMLRIATIGLPWSFIVGTYLVLTMTFRFAEEQYRGEPQTPVFAGLTLYQWLSIGWGLIGLALMTLPTNVAVLEWQLTPREIALSAMIAAIALLTMSVDFPNSTKPLSRLTVAPPASNSEGK